MDIHGYGLLVASLVNDIKRNKNVTLLLGSAISLPHVPNVDKIILIIEEYIKENELILDVNSTFKKTESTNKYQEMFRDVLAVGDQDDIKNIMSMVMSKAKDSNGEWKISDTVTSLTKLISAHARNIKNILTTNFDPLLEESFKSSGVKFRSIILNKDSHIDDKSEYDADTINVVHLHGFWNGDTMHTANQLSVHRGELKSSLKKILKQSKLYVIGYGGWDDVINSVFNEIMEEHEFQYDIRWGFYSNDDAKINYENEVLLKTLNRAISAGRFNAYKNVDCSLIFEDAFKRLNNKKLENKDAYANSSGEHDNQLAKDELHLTSFANKPDPSHCYIRLAEQGKAIDELKGRGNFTLLSGWGFGKFGFIASLLSDDFYDFIQYRVDLSNVESKEQAEKKIKSDIGADFTYLVDQSNMGHKSVIIFDNIINLNDDIVSYLNTLIGIISDYPNIKGIFVVFNNPVRLANELITLTALDVNDIKEYISTDKSSVQYSISEFEIIYRISSGLPFKLDKLKKSLAITSLSHIFEEFNSGSEPDARSMIQLDSLPKELVVKLNELKASSSLDGKRKYTLLKVLSLFPSGEQPKLISRHYHDEKFKVDDYVELNNLCLTSVIDVEGYSEIKLNQVAPLVRDYILSEMMIDDLLIQRHKAMKLTLGEYWQQGKINLSFSEKVCMHFIQLNPGNAPSLLISELKNIISSKQHITEILRASKAYCMLLKADSRYKEINTFSKEVFDLISRDDSYESCDFYWIVYYLSDSFRMLNQDDSAIDLLIKNLEKTALNGKFYNKSLHEKMNSTLLLCYEQSDENKAFKLAGKLRTTSPKNSYMRLLSDSVLTNKFTKHERINKLKLIEKKARNNNHVGLANNICLDLAVLLPVQKSHYAEIVMNSKDCDYTQTRAFILNCDCILKSNGFLDEKDKSKLMHSYTYLFSQRMDGLFNKCHKLLWSIFVGDMDVDFVYFLLSRGSLIWRINQDTKEELQYLTDFKSLILDNNNYYYIDRYIDKRISYINSINNN